MSGSLWSVINRRIQSHRVPSKRGHMTRSLNPRISHHKRPRQRGAYRANGFRSVTRHVNQGIGGKLYLRGRPTRGKSRTISRIAAVALSGFTPTPRWTCLGWVTCLASATGGHMDREDTNVAATRLVNLIDPHGLQVRILSFTSQLPYNKDNSPNYLFYSNMY